jgi:hypothetical protein
MRIDLAKTTISALAGALLLLGLAARAADPSPPVDDLSILRDKIRADKKLLVASNMDLTEAEAKGFWPIYDEYQKDLQAINARIADQLESYADDLRGNTLTDESAKKLIEKSVAIEQSEAALKSKFAPKLSKVLPARKVVRYLQIENKIRALVRYDLASGVPLVQ